MTQNVTQLAVIVTGATGMVGEGVLLECLENPAVERVLMVNRKPQGMTHPKLTECIVADFLDLDAVTSQLAGYDACFYCAGVSSRGMSEAAYSKVTYDTPLHFAHVLEKVTPNMVFCHVSGALTDSTEKGRVMWARVKGKAENALMRCAFKGVYNFRPGMMKPMPGQKNVKGYYKAVATFYPMPRALFPSQVSTMREVAVAMIACARVGYPKQVLEVKDIVALANA